jgi:hypothetical protein
VRAVIVIDLSFVEWPEVYCRDCARYDPESKRCKDAKVNPQDWETAVTVAQVLGLRSICVFNDYRERLVRARGLDAQAKIEPENE